MVGRWTLLGTVAVLGAVVAATLPAEAPRYTDCHNAYCVEPSWAETSSFPTVERNGLDLTSVQVWLTQRPQLSESNLRSPYTTAAASGLSTLERRAVDDRYRTGSEDALDPTSLRSAEWATFLDARTQLARTESRRLRREAGLANARPVLALGAGVLGLLAFLGLRRRRRARQQSFRFERRTHVYWWGALGALLLALVCTQTWLGLYTDAGPPPSPASCSTVACVEPSWNGDTLGARVNVSPDAEVESVQWWVENHPPVRYQATGVELKGAALQAFHAAKPLVLAAAMEERRTWARHRRLAQQSRAWLPYTVGLLLAVLCGGLVQRRRRCRHQVVVRDHSIVVDGTVHDYEDFDVEGFEQTLLAWSSVQALGPYTELSTALDSARQRSLATRATSPTVDLTSIDAEVYHFDHPLHATATKRAALLGRLVVLGVTATVLIGALAFTPVGETPFPGNCVNASCIQPTWAEIHSLPDFHSRLPELDPTFALDAAWWMDNRPPLEDRNFEQQPEDILYTATYDAFLNARSQLANHEQWRRLRWTVLIRTAGYARQAFVPTGLLAGLLFLGWLVARRRADRTRCCEVTVGRHHVDVDGVRFPYEGQLDNDLGLALQALIVRGFIGNRTLVVHRANQLAAVARRASRDPDAERRLQELTART